MLKQRPPPREIDSNRRERRGTLDNFREVDLSFTDLVAAMTTCSDDTNNRTMVVPCPFNNNAEGIRVQVQGETDQGIPDVLVALRDAGMRGKAARTDPAGTCVFSGLRPGTYTLILPELDEEAWVVLGQERWQDVNSDNRIADGWGELSDREVKSASMHHVQPGECGAKIAAMYGFFPETVWNDSRNASLRATRKSLYILAPDDQLTIPSLRQKSISVPSSTAVVLKRRGVPEQLKVRFVDCMELPRAGLPFMLTAHLPQGVVIAPVEGRTDEDGFLLAMIPPESTHVDILLRDRGRVEDYTLEIGFIAPEGDVRGWQARLNNLGFFCGAIDGEYGSRTRQAVMEFQRHAGLKVTGSVEGETQRELVRRFLA